MSSETSETLRERLRKHHEVILLGAILLVALALRLYQLERSSLWLDELMQVQVAREPWWRVPKAALAYPGSAPLDYLVTHFVYYYVGRSEGILRLPAVVWGVLTVAAVYFLGKRMFDKTSGFLAAAILTILPSHVYYSQEVRPYSLPALMIVLATFAFYHTLERNTRGTWALYGATLAVGMYAHYYVAVVGILHGAYLVLMALAKRLPWNRLLPYVIAAGIAGLLFLPWVLADQFRSGFRFQMPSTSILLSAAFVAREGDALWANFHPLRAFVGLAWGCILAGVAMAIAGRPSARRSLSLLGSVTLLGMTTVVAMDYAAPYFFSGRQFLPYAPLLILLMAASAVLLVRMAAKRLASARAREAVTTLAAVLMIAFSVATLAQPLSQGYRYTKQDWRGVGRYLLQHAARDDAILLRETFDVQFYAPELKSQIIRLRNPETIVNAAKTKQRVWIVADLTTGFGSSRPDAAQWLTVEKPHQIPGFPGLALYVYSEQMTREELEASLRRW